MTRFAFVFLAYWPVERFLRENKGAREDGDRPFALIASQAGGFRLAAVNLRAEKLGLVAGELLSDARARIPRLSTAEANPARDGKALIELARWCARFSPYVAPWPRDGETDDAPHGLIFDIVGCAHLFGGEENLIRAMETALTKLGFTARLAIADTIGAAIALCTHGKEKQSIVPFGKQKDALKPLPVAALRLGEHNLASLNRLGLKRIGDVVDLPRAPLAARFGGELIRRLDQILGKAREPFSPLIPHAPYRVHAQLAEPISSKDHIVALAKKLAGDLVPVLTRDGKAAREYRLTLFRVDGKVTEIALRLARGTRDPAHAAKLFALRLNNFAQDYDAGFGFDAARLGVPDTENASPEQETLDSEGDAAAKDHVSLLIDRLGSRLGVENVIRLFPRASHIPERAVMARAAAYHPQAKDANWEGLPEARPFLMLPAVEPAEVVALLPEGPPRQFRWRSVVYSVAHAEGPERICSEWWRNESNRSRDYYTVEDEEGRRFWLYREGAYGAPAPPRWFVHGVFA